MNEEYISEIIKKLKTVPGAVTIENASWTLDVGTKVTIIAIGPVVALMRGTITAISAITNSTTIVDFKLTIHCNDAINNHVGILTFLLSSLNGRSALIGDEQLNNYSRLFVDLNHAVNYLDSLDAIPFLLNKKRTTNTPIVKLKSLPPPKLE